MRRALTVLAWLPLVVGCGGLAPRDFERARLEANLARWRSVGPSSYRYALRRSCYCPGEYIGPVRVTVSADTVFQRVYVESGDPVPDEAADAFPTVDGLFELLTRAFDDGADRIDVTYDPELGVPIEISIDYLEDAVDDELGILVTESVRGVAQALASAI